MRLTPLDIREQQFRRVMRGLDPEEVASFLASVAGEYESLLTEHRDMQQRLLEYDEKLQEYRSMEKALRDTLLTAERVMTESRDSAQREAHVLIREAELAAERATATISQQIMHRRAELAELRRLKDAYMGRLRWLLQSNLEMVDGYAQEFAEIDAGLPAEVRSQAPPRRRATSPVPDDVSPEATAGHAAPPRDVAAWGDLTAPESEPGRPGRLAPRAAPEGDFDVVHQVSADGSYDSLTVVTPESVPHARPVLWNGPQASATHATDGATRGLGTLQHEFGEAVAESRWSLQQLRDELRHGES